MSAAVNDRDRARLGITLREARLAAGLSLYRAAGDELSVPALHKIERGAACPTAEHLVYLAGRLGLDLKVLVPLWARCHQRVPSQLYWMGRLLQKMGAQDAAAALLPYLENDRADSDRWAARIALEKGHLQMNCSAYQESVRSFRAAATLAERHSDWECKAEADAFTGFVLRRLWRPTSAMRYLQAAAKQIPQTNPLRARLMINLGHAQVEAKAYRAALETYQALDGCPDDPFLKDSLLEGKAIVSIKLAPHRSPVKRPSMPSTSG